MLAIEKVLLKVWGQISPNHQITSYALQRISFLYVQHLLFIMWNQVQLLSLLMPILSFLFALSFFFFFFIVTSGIVNLSVKYVSLSICRINKMCYLFMPSFQNKSDHMVSVSSLFLSLKLLSAFGSFVESLLYIFSSSLVKCFNKSDNHLTRSTWWYLQPYSRI